MPRQAVVVFIDAATPLDAEIMVGHALMASEDARPLKPYAQALSEPRHNVDGEA